MKKKLNTSFSMNKRVLGMYLLRTQHKFQTCEFFCIIVLPFVIMECFGDEKLSPNEKPASTSLLMLITQDIILDQQGFQQLFCIMPFLY